MRKSTLLLAAGLTAAFATSASAETRVTYKSAKSTSSYYQMAVQLAEAMKKGSNGDIILTVKKARVLYKTSKKPAKEPATMFSQHHLF